MPTSNARQQLQALLNEVTDNPPADLDERAELLTLLQAIEQHLVEDQLPAEETLNNDLNLMIERFAISHPALSATLRDVVQSLANMGI